MHLSPGLVVADRFKLERVLGEGGMGSVWLAQHTALDVPCAVKFIHPDAAKSEEIRARFEREAKAAAQLRSPYVVQILDHGVWEESPYIAMELLDGEDLEHRLERRGRLTPQETMAVALHVGRALTRAHAAGLVHRDLKPANIFLVKDDEREIAKVLDFGIAKTTAVRTDGKTKTGAVLGTPYYMSPEQARGNKTLDHRADLWSLAVVVYECLTGKLPFESETLGDLLAKIMFEPIPVPSAIAPVPPGFDGWWTRATMRDPAVRFQSAKELTDALGLALGVTVPYGADVAANRGPSVRPPAGKNARDSSEDLAATALERPRPSPPAGVSPARTSGPRGTVPSTSTNPPLSSSTSGALAVPLQRRVPLALLGVVGAAIVGLGAFAVLRSSGAHAVPAATATAEVPPPSARAPEPPPSASAPAPEVVVVPSPSASAAAPATATATASAPATSAATPSTPPAAGAPHPKLPPRPGGRKKDDFGI